jgi:hypothetical protein
MISLWFAPLIGGFGRDGGPLFQALCQAAWPLLCGGQADG